MTKDDIILMADASGIAYYGMGKDRDKFLHYLETFANLVSAAEREAITALREALAREHALHDLARLGQEIEQEPTPWRDMIVATLVREGINKHKARELADHFAAQRQWVGLTDKELQFYRKKYSKLVNVGYYKKTHTNVVTEAFDSTGFYKEVSTVLKERNTCLG